MKVHLLQKLLPLILGLLALSLPYTQVRAAYPLVQIQNNTEHPVNGVVEYLSCRSDAFSVKPGKTWRAKSRGLCLVSGISGNFVSPIKVDKNGNISGGFQLLEPYSSSGTSYAKFQVNEYGDKYSIYSEPEWARKSKAFTLAYPLAEVKNNTEYTVSGVINYVACKADKFSVGPGEKWTAKSRGVCLIANIKGELNGIPASLKGTGRTSYGEKKEIVPYTSSPATSFSQFQVNAYGDRYQIFSENEWAKEGKIDSRNSPGFRLVNETQWPVAYSLDQVGCLYYGVVPAAFNGKDGVAVRDTGAVWFTLRAHIQPDGKNTQKDMDCVEPVAEVVGGIFLAVISDGASAEFEGIEVTAATLAKSAVKASVKEIASVAKSQIGEYLKETGAITMFGQYAGYAWPFRCDAMPEYHITGGPSHVKDPDGNGHIIHDDDFKITKVNDCGNGMMKWSPLSKVAPKEPREKFYKETVRNKTGLGN